VSGAVPRSGNGACWLLRGVTSNDRYVTTRGEGGARGEKPALGRPEQIGAALIPIRKNAKWWAMTQDERGKVFEEQSITRQWGLDTCLP